MARKKVNITGYVSDLCMAHLLWNYLLRKNLYKDDATLELLRLSQGVVYDIVRQEIFQHGTTSVDCGPNEDYGSSKVEDYAVALVRRAFKF